MATNRPFISKSYLTIGLSLISFLLFSSLTLVAQNLTNFSGKWEFDKSQSDKNERGNASFNGTIVLEINQNTSLITFSSTLFIPGKKGYIMPADSFYVDGRVTKGYGGTGPAKKFTKWSKDNKTLTTNLIMTDSIDGVAQEFLTANTYKLSDDRKTLTIELLNKSKLNGESKVKEVYKKKM